MNEYIINTGDVFINTGDVFKITVRFTEYGDSISPRVHLVHERFWDDDGIRDKGFSLPSGLPLGVDRIQVLLGTARMRRMRMKKTTRRFLIGSLREAGFKVSDTEDGLVRALATTEYPQEMFTYAYEAMLFLQGEIDLSALKRDAVDNLAEVVLRQKAGDLVDKDMKEAFGRELSEAYNQLGTIRSTATEMESTFTKLHEAASNVQPLIDKELARVKTELEPTMKEMAGKALADVAERYRPVVIQQGKKKKSLGDKVVPEEFDHILKLASQRMNIMLVGPSGCGKTHIAGMVAEALDLDFGAQSCSEGMSESQVAGWLLPIGDGGKMEYVPSVFVNLYENGGVFLFDEIDSADANMLTFVNNALSGDGFYLPQRHHKPYVKKHKDFVCVAAANTFGHGGDEMYVGRNQLDKATLDRFQVGTVYMDYSPAVEERLVSPDLLQWGRVIRKAIKDRKMERIMSTRTLINLEQMKEAYEWGREEWEQSFFVGWNEQEVRQVKEYLDLSYNPA